MSQAIIKEIQTLFLCLLAALIGLSLGSYNIHDPGFTHSAGYTGTLHNHVGWFGAYMADGLLSLFGLVSFLLPALVILLAVSLHRQTQTSNWSWRSLGMGLTLMALCGLLSLSVESQMTRVFTSGGLLGFHLSRFLVQWFQLMGSVMILLLLLVCGMSLAAETTWQSMLIKPMSWRPRLRPRPDFHERVKEPVSKTTEVLPKAIMTSEKTGRPSSKPRRNKKTLYTGLLSKHSQEKPKNGKEALARLSDTLQATLQEYGIDAQVVEYHPGPVVTRFELDLAAGTKVSRISALAKDLARSLSVTAVRVVEVIPGKSTIGIEVPNAHRQIVSYRELLEAAAYRQSRAALPLALGKDIAGYPVIVDLAKMPHLLVAGTTGSGKSVGLNAMLLSLLFKASPEELRILMIDPKMLELSVYQDIPHLLAPVVTNMQEAAQALQWCVSEMERRYTLMAALGVRNIIGYNEKIQSMQQNNQDLFQAASEQFAEHIQDTEIEKLPYIVVVADEFADLVMVVGKKVEQLIARLAQKARAAGIHIILATQRPSVDVITGLIKANIPTRIAFQVSSKVDSRTILDQAGAEQLLGHGDMLYLAPGTGVPVRVHGAFVSDEEVHAVCDALRLDATPDYVDLYTGGEFAESSEGSQDTEQDALYDEAVAFVIDKQKVSVSSVQRQLRIGYNRAANLVEAMEKAGIVSAPSQGGQRKVLVPSRETI